MEGFDMTTTGKRFPKTVSVNLEQYQVNLLDMVSSLEDRPKSWVFRKFLDEGMKTYFKGTDMKEYYEKEYESRWSNK
jgi:hypothetical protein